MSADLLLGAPIIAELRQQCLCAVDRLRESGTVPHLVIIDATDDEASHYYAQAKMRQASQLGIRASLFDFRSHWGEGGDSSVFQGLVRPLGISRAADIEPRHFLDLIAQLGKIPDIHGIFIERPLPGQLCRTNWDEYMPARLDVEGEHPENIGRLFLSEPQKMPVYIPTTALSCLEMLKFYRIPLDGRHAVVVGRSVTVGKPAAWLLLQENATVTICHSHTSDLAAQTRRADILVVATGQSHLITGDMVKPGAVVLDVGINYDENGDVHGDVDFDSVKEVAGAISPIKGGLGPVTTSILLHNVVKAACLSSGVDFEAFRPQKQ